MAKNTNLSTVESKKQTKQTGTENYRNSGGCQMGWGCGGKGEEVRGLRSTNRQFQNSHGDVKYSIGNGVAREPIHMTHGHGQWCGDCLREWGMQGGKGKSETNQDNCNSIINKI